MDAIKDNVVLLTGASRGLGQIIAAALAERGAHLALVARSVAGLTETQLSLQRFGVRTAILPADLARPDAREGLVERAQQALGPLDILVNNAGVESEGAFVELDQETLRQTIEVNFVAPVDLTRQALPHMLERHSGHVVNIASIAAKAGSAYAAIYCGTKAGLAEWTRGLRLELAGTGVHFSTICPGYVTETGMFARFGMTPPMMVGSCTPRQVARAVLHAIDHRRVEVVVNSTPLRPLFALGELSPALGDWLMDVTGATAFQRRKATSGTGTGFD